MTDKKGIELKPGDYIICKTPHDQFISFEGEVLENGRLRDIAGSGPKYPVVIRLSPAIFKPEHITIIPNSS